MPSKQGRLAGMQSKEMIAIEEKAVEVKTAERERMEASEREVQARAELLVLMRDAKVTKVDLGENPDLGEGEYEAVVKRQEAKVYVRPKKRKKEEAEKDAKAADKEVDPEAKEEVA